MLAQFFATLHPLNLVIGGLLFFNLAWLAVRKYVLLGIVGLSAGEFSLPHFWAQAGHIGPGALLGPLHDIGAAQAFSDLLIANAMLAAAIWFAVRSLQLWARATTRREEERFMAMIERDESLRQRHDTTRRVMR